MAHTNPNRPDVYSRITDKIIADLEPRLSGSRGSFPLCITVEPSELDWRIVKRVHRRCLGYRGGSGDA